MRRSYLGAEMMGQLLQLSIRKSYLGAEIIDQLLQLAIRKSYRYLGAEMIGQPLQLAIRKSYLGAEMMGQPTGCCVAGQLLQLAPGQTHSFHLLYPPAGGRSRCRKPQSINQTRKAIIQQKKKNFHSTKIILSQPQIFVDDSNSILLKSV